jgi:H+/Cl- antiporter ClcA
MITPAPHRSNGVVVTTPEETARRVNNWKLQTYVVGLGLGVLFGVISSYLYVRAAEEDVTRRGEPAPVKTTELIGLGLAALAVVRQITEMGKPDPKRK